MNTSKLLLVVFGGLIGLSVIAVLWMPRIQPDGRIPLVWVSDTNPARQAKIQAFNDENPDLTLVLDFGNMDTQKIILQSVSGVGPDVFDFDGVQLETYLQSGILWDVTEPAAKMGFSGKDAGWPEGFHNYIQNGRQYGYPNNMGSQILLFNKNVFEHFGIPVPKAILTWDEFFELAQKVNSLTNPEGAQGKEIFAISGLNHLRFFESLRGEYFDEGGRPFIEGNEPLRQALELHRDLLFKYRVAPTSSEVRQMTAQGGWGAGSLNHFASGRYAMIITGHWALISLSRNYWERLGQLERQGLAPSQVTNPLDRPLRLGAVPFPHAAGMPPHYWVSSRVVGINARSPRREESLKFLQFLAGPTYSKLVNETSDFLPPNPQFADLGVEPGPPDLARLELQASTIEAVRHGYTPRSSPFLMTLEVMRVLGGQVGLLESNPSLSTEGMLATAQTELNRLMRRNLDRDLELKARFIERFGEPAYQALK